jgi:hypothetical protein
VTPRRAHAHACTRCSSWRGTRIASNTRPGRRFSVIRSWGEFRRLGGVEWCGDR